MNSRRSYLDTLNTGRQRRVHSSLEELNRTVDRLGQRLDPVERQRLDPPAGEGQDRRAPSRPLAAGSNWAQTDMQFEPAAEPARRRAAPQPSPRMPAGESSYEAITREIDRYRRPDDSGASASRVAAELKGLREELRHQMTAGLRREFDTLRKDIQRAYSQSSAVRDGAELGAEFDRLSGAIRTLSEKSDDKGINMLRLELEQVKGALDNLAREETVRSVGSRWDEFDQRWTKFEDKLAKGHAADPAIDALNARLEQINEAVNGLPESLSLRSLEDKVRTLAGAVEHFATKQEDYGAGVLGMVEERLDEISRAIVASAAVPQPSPFDTEPFERIEARITSLAGQIEELLDDRPSNALFSQIELLARRVDEIAARGQMPEKAMERLAAQIADIADRIDAGQAAPDAEHILRGIEQRFDMLSDVLDRRQGDAIEHSQALFRDLERRLEDVTVRLDQRIAAPSNDAPKLMEAIDQRFADLARRMEERAAKTADPVAIRQIESRLDDISARLEAAPSQPGGFDPSSIIALEEQVAALSRNLSRPAAASAEIQAIAPRLDEIERTMAFQHDNVLAAAREAADSAVRTLAGSGSSVEAAAVAGLAEDLKSIEMLNRRSDERNTKTFEAIHDTLLKIVERLGELEHSTQNAVRHVPEPASRILAAERRMPVAEQLRVADDEPEPLDPVEYRLDPVEHRLDPLEQLRREPAPKRTPAEAAAAAAVAALDQEEDADASAGGRVRSMFGGLTRALGGKKERAEPALAGSNAPIEPTLEIAESRLDAPLDPRIANQPLEPGSGAPDVNAIMRKVRGEAGQAGRGDTDAAKSDFIAAARRAAQAAAADAGIAKRGAEPGKPAGGSKLGEIFRTRRKPILMAAVAVLVVLAALQLSKAFFRDSGVEIAQMADPVVTDEPAATSAGDVVIDETAGDELPADEAIGDESFAATSQDETPAVSIGEPVRSAGAGEVMAEPAGAASAATTATPDEVAKAEIAPTATPTETVTAAPAIEPAPVDAGPVALREAADAGDPKAMFEIGSRYADGRGVKADMAEASKWYTRSAELGFAPAQYRIGNFHEKGIGVKRDVATAKTWYQMSAEQGNASAMHNLAVLFAMGADGVTDNESAARWFTRAADLGVKDSQFNLGILAAKGVGVPQSLEESYKWFALVAKTGDRDATTKRDEVANALRPEQLTRARAAVELWKPQQPNVEANSVDIPDAWREGGGTTAAIDMKKAVQNIQALLNKAGYDAGNPDGLMGSRTKAAIAAYQKDHGMEPNGEVDEKLVRALLDSN
jgi:localization factor PodJL